MLWACSSAFDINDTHPILGDFFLYEQHRTVPVSIDIARKKYKIIALGGHNQVK
jgi:hypothetical protein